MADPDNNNNTGGGDDGSGESQNNHHTINQIIHRTKSIKSRKRDVSFRDEDESEDQEGDVEVWNSFNDGFRQVQSVLDRNRILIQQVNENHRSKLAQNMTKNVALIQEMNENISRIVSIYSNLSTVFRHRGGAAAGDRNCAENSD